MNYIKRQLLKLFVRSADDIISFLDSVEGRIRELAIKADAQAGTMLADAEALRQEALTIQANAQKAYRLADRIHG